MGIRVLQESSSTDKHSCNVSALCCFDDKVVSGSDDGLLKLWTSDLKLLKEVDTMKGGVMSLAASSDAIYTCGSDETIQAWDRNTLQNIGQLQTTLYVPQKIFLEPKTNCLWAGDSQGKVAKFIDMKESEKYELVEEVWDILVTCEPVLVYTARDRDIAVSEIVSGNTRKNAVIKATLKGRSPMVIEESSFCCLDREGRLIQVFENKVESMFKHLRNIQASELIVNAMCSGGNGTVYAGGYDSKISQWNVSSASCQGSVEVSSCVNALQSATSGAYAATTDGRVLLVGP